MHRQRRVARDADRVHDHRRVPDQEVRQHPRGQPTRRASRPRPPRADDDHRRRVQHAAHRPGLGAVLAVGHHRERPVGGVDVEPDGHDAVLGALPDLVPGLLEDGDHAAVLRQDLRDEPPHAPLARGRGEVLEQHGPQAAALVGVRDVERDLGLVGADAVVPGDADDLVLAVRSRPARHGDQSHPVDVVDGDQPRQVALGQPLQRGEEPQVGRPLRLPDVERLERVGVVRPQRAHVRGRAVVQHDVRLPRGRVRETRSRAAVSRDVCHDASRLVRRAAHWGPGQRAAPVKGPGRSTMVAAQPDRPPRSKHAWRVAPRPPTSRPRTSSSASSTSTSRPRWRARSSSTPTPSSTRGPCPTPATASSRCSAGSSTRCRTWACARTART